ncbi:hypothetical protein EDD16DRAFT_1475158 [Pisolithus croceorrhizus]|nr:hypothetical protein EDD16DRAFT_1475158 [Pisolithus croceorrhizus]KAI6129555.1 hypothetical protein EV401DRAFT_2256195 [Pisolithus croceorrhizus]KAI6161637.1 hypothetical protein EDD17DRAFT_1697239 [Pisolithus thermaeus]
MSATIIIGFFALAGGKRIKTVEAGSPTVTYHCVYETTIQCTSGAIFPASLRVCSPFNDVALPDNTVAFVSAKASVPASVPQEPVLLEAFHLAPVPGDPSTDSYEQTVPDFPYPTVIGLGTVSSQPRVLADGTSKVFAALSSDYVRDARLNSVVHCVFDSSRARWSKLPVPHHDSVVWYVGQFGDKGLGSGLRVDLESIELDVGVQDFRQARSSAAPGSKRRKFQAVALPGQRSET